MAVDTTESEFSAMRSRQPRGSVEKEVKRKFVTSNRHGSAVFCLQKNTRLSKELRDNLLKYPLLLLFPADSPTVTLMSSSTQLPTPKKFLEASNDAHALSDIPPPFVGPPWTLLYFPVL